MARKRCREDNKGYIAGQFETKRAEASIRGTEIIEAQSGAACFVSFIDIDNLDPLVESRFIEEVIKAGKMTLVSL